ncbi:MAG: sigma-70 family RNA polymerase sigma factor [Clostridiales bacterium]|nr:sigma-70 family RNA polymerase sigma factor [Clostridiales bacterium]
MLICLSVLDTEEEKGLFTRLYETYGHLLWYIARDILKDDHLAEDAVQEAFLALTRHIDKVKGEEAAKTKRFLATIVKSKAIDLLRKQKSKKEDLLDVESQECLLGMEEENALSGLLKQESMERICDAVGKLDESYRIVFELKVLHELSDQEIGEILGISPKLANVRMFRARKKLQDFLEEEYGYDR